MTEFTITIEGYSKMSNFKDNFEFIIVVYTVNQGMFLSFPGENTIGLLAINL